MLYNSLNWFCFLASKYVGMIYSGGLYDDIKRIAEDASSSCEPLKKCANSLYAFVNEHTTLQLLVT